MWVPPQRLATKHLVNPFASFQILAHGRDASMIRESLHTIALVLKNCLAIDKPVLRRALENMAEQTIAVVFRIIDSELISMQTPAIAEVLHLFAKSYPSQTR